MLKPLQSSKKIVPSFNRIIVRISTYITITWNRTLYSTKNMAFKNLFTYSVVPFLGELINHKLVVHTHGSSIETQYYQIFTMCIDHGNPKKHKDYTYYFKLFQAKQTLLTLLHTVHTKTY